MTLPRVSGPTEGRPRGKDWWDKAQVLGTFFLGLVGAAFTLVLREQEERNRSVQEATLVMNQREQSEIDLKQKVFGSLMDKLMGRDRVRKPTEQLTLLRALEQNFHETFDGRAFFDQVAAAAQRDADLSTRQRVLRGLNALGRETSTQQEMIVESNVNYEFPGFWIQPGDTATVDLILRQNPGYQPSEVHVDPGCHAATVVPTRADHHHTVCLAVNKVFEDSVGLTLWFGAGPDPTNSHINSRFRLNSAEVRKRSFFVSYFDTPFTDNILLPDGHRLSVILKEDSAARAQIKVLEFPEDYIIGGYRPSLQKVRGILAGAPH